MTASEIVILLADRTLTQRRRADLEFRLFDATPLEVRASARTRTTDRISILRAVYGAAVVDAKAEPRSRLYHAGEAAESLWRLVDVEGVALLTAQRLLVEARKRSRTGHALAVEIDDGIEAWRDRTIVVRTASGRIMRRRVEVKIPSAPEALDTVRAALRAYVDAYAGQTDRASGKRLVGEAIADVEALLLGFEARVRQAARRSSDQAEPPRSSLRTVREACEVLTVAPPGSFGRPIDLADARRRFRMLVRRYHPDVSGTAETRGLFEAVVGAMREVESYADAVETLRAATRTNETNETKAAATGG